MRRSYRQFCGVARALDLIGERWTLLLVRNLLLGPRRYSELLTGLPGITTNLLASRLKELESAGLVAATGAGYALTEGGAALEPVVNELGRWGGRWMDAPRKGDVIDPGWAMLSWKRRYVGGQTGVLGLVVGGLPFELVFTRARLVPRRGDAVRPDAVVSIPGMATVRQLIAGPPPASLEIVGDRAAALRMLGSLQLQLPVGG